MLLHLFVFILKTSGLWHGYVNFLINSLFEGYLQIFAHSGELMVIHICVQVLFILGKSLE